MMGLAEDLTDRHNVGGSNDYDENVTASIAAINEVIEQCAVAAESCCAKPDTPDERDNAYYDGCQAAVAAVRAMKS